MTEDTRQMLEEQMTKIEDVQKCLKRISWIAK